MTTGKYVRGSEDAIELGPKTKQLVIINEAFDEIPELQDGFTVVSERLFEMNVESEKRHRKDAPDGIRNGISVSTAAKLFTVRHLLDGWKNPNKWTVDDILSIRNEVLYAQAYAKKFHDELVTWAQKWYTPFKDVDYSELMRQQERKQR